MDKRESNKTNDLESTNLNAIYDGDIDFLKFGCLYCK